MSSFMTTRVSLLRFYCRDYPAVLPTRTTRIATSTSLLAGVNPASSSFTTPRIRDIHSSSKRCCALKESDENIDVGELKERHLQNHKEGKAQWNESLASDSEAFVKADRNYIPSTKEIDEIEGTWQNKRIVSEKGWKKEEEKKKKIVENVPTKEKPGKI